MIILTIIGFVALLISALYFSAAAFATFVASAGLTGKVGVEAYFLAALAVITWALVIGCWPFEIALKGGA